MANQTPTPDKLKPLLFHGADLRHKGGDNWEGTCPFCSKEKHFYAHPETGQWDCKVCGVSGNVFSFLPQLIKQCKKDTTRIQLKRLSRQRGIPSGILRQNDVCFHAHTNAWLIPAYNVENKIVNVVKWSSKTKGTFTWGCKAMAFGLADLNNAGDETEVWLCESFWDKMAVEWLLRELGDDESVVVALPGAGTFKDEWAKLFEGVHLIHVFDADEAGAKGEEKAADKTRTYVRSSRFVRWPESRPTGYDIRDFLTSTLGEGEDPKKTLKALKGLFSEFPRRHEPTDEERKSVEKKKKRKKLDAATYEQVHEVFEQSMAMNTDSRNALDLCLAVCASNEVSGDPLWLYLVGPPSCGKTMLLSALQASDRCVFRSTVTPHCLVSGWRGEGKNDPSLVPKLVGKTFVAKDFTEILTMSSTAQDEIFSTLRGAYDGRVQKSFGNGVFRNYEGCYFSALAGVTNAIHAHPKANLGERFLKYQFRVQDRDAAKIVNQAALASIGKEKKTETALQNVVSSFLEREFLGDNLPSLPDHLFERLNALVQMIAVLRTMVERDWRGGELAYRPAVEGSARLIKQLGKLAMCIALIRGETEVTDEIYSLVERVAYDSAHGFHMDVIRAMMKRGGTAQKKHVSDLAGIPYSTIHRHFEDLEVLGVIERVRDDDTVKSSQYAKVKRTAGRPAATFAVTQQIVELWYQSKGKQCPRKQKKQSAKKTVHRKKRKKINPTKKRVFQLKQL